MMWMEFWVWSVVCSGIATSAQTLFPSCVWGCPKGLLEAENFGKLFLSFFSRFCWEFNHLGSQNSSRAEHRNVLRR